MNLRPLPPEQYTDDATIQRVRRCCKCDGEMRCKSLIEFRLNGGYSGRDYTFVCQGCRQIVTELSLGQVLFRVGLVVLSGGLGGIMVTFGLEILIDTVTHGFGGNDPSAVIVVLILFLGIGAPFLWLTLSSSRALISDWLKLRRNPIVR